MKINKKSNIAMSKDEQKESMLNTFKMLIDYLDEHELRYYLVGGTMIGAVRHGGFIPWDDDIDICMPISDYEEFLKITAEKPIAPNLYVTSYRNNPNHIWPMSKVIDTNTYLVEPNVRKKYRKKQELFGGVYVDVFPLYGVPEDEQSRKKFCDTTFSLYKSYKRSIRLVKRGDTVLTKIRFVLSTASHIPYRIISPEYYLQRLDKLVYQYDFDSSTYCAFALGIVPYPKDVNPKKYFDGYEIVKFEGLECHAPKMYKEYLENQFGDYMKLPSEDQRKIHPRIVYKRG